ncbi:tRNA (adenosine(37)-N6)-threonylcarbamoyltransferase complex ATPase subunit type 1 TsaE [Mucilaginibacter sp. KACC 22063]|uniref:tRNA (adenosine(37)-N6)-threonylcarbamoyltransferase complex ATPase subunit type 1 TsaE n=1 Tax=Mucilaginibacter sp. KACC 22063 TaxID=3025666 RepID=UPI002366CF0C|nr:tRNA (adenosine(37)-N6)-threonylcarbamoyltransferase complex ATPase subunit type 1 TsaE [Mucilaginibacter sp. KACC 22063]WDF55351.1 tRNA (adenosine(37)-N6)-threonylcarbamoyltransferase complex ATPase subunit type 1 TsaE [Mucilaginibacter sp. KACC 22063]
MTGVTNENGAFELTLHSTADLPATAQQIVSFADKQRIFLFFGEMGAGKTTTIKALCAALGVEEAVTSPTFSIVNEYRGKGNTVYHFDFYRLKSQSEAFDMGYEEYFYSDAYCFIEWPEKIADLLPEHFLKVSIDTLGETSRKIIAEHI